MAQWQKHMLGLVLPLLIVGVLLTIMPRHSPPDWMVHAGAISIVIVFLYCFHYFERWMKARQNYTKVAIVILLVGLVGIVVGLRFGLSSLVALGGLVNVAIGIFVIAAIRWFAARIRQRED